MWYLFQTISITFVVCSSKSIQVVGVKLYIFFHVYVSTFEALIKYPTHWVPLKTSLVRTSTRLQRTYVSALFQCSKVTTSKIFYFISKPLYPFTTRCKRDLVKYFFQVWQNLKIIKLSVKKYSCLYFRKWKMYDCSVSK